MSVALSTWNNRIRGHYWLCAFVAVVVCSLTLSLATRFCNHIAPSTHIAKALERRSVQPQRQHLNRDATRWVVSTADSAFFGLVTLDSRVVSAEILPTKDPFGEAFSIRPPPSFRVIL